MDGKEYPPFSGTERRRLVQGVAEAAGKVVPEPHSRTASRGWRVLPLLRQRVSRRGNSGGTADFYQVRPEPNRFGAGLFSAPICACTKPRRVRAHRREKMQSVFGRDMYVDENTTRPANVRTARFPCPAQTQRKRFARGEEEQGSVCSFRLGGNETSRTLRRRALRQAANPRRKRLCLFRRFEKE